MSALRIADVTAALPLTIGEEHVKVYGSRRAIKLLQEHLDAQTAMLVQVTETCTALLEYAEELERRVGIMG